MCACVRVCVCVYAFNSFTRFCRPLLEPNLTDSPNGNAASGFYYYYYFFFFRYYFFSSLVGREPRVVRRRDYRRGATVRKCACVARACARVYNNNSSSSSSSVRLRSCYNTIYAFIYIYRYCYRRSRRCRRCCRCCSPCKVVVRCASARQYFFGIFRGAEAFYFRPVFRRFFELYFRITVHGTVTVPHDRRIRPGHFAVQSHPCLCEHRDKM